MEQKAPPQMRGTPQPPGNSSCWAHLRRHLRLGPFLPYLLSSPGNGLAASGISPKALSLCKMLCLGCVGGREHHVGVVGASGRGVYGSHISQRPVSYTQSCTLDYQGGNSDWRAKGPIPGGGVLRWHLNGPIWVPCRETREMEPDGRE